MYRPLVSVDDVARAIARFIAPVTLVTPGPTADAKRGDFERALAESNARFHDERRGWLSPSSRSGQGEPGAGVHDTSVGLKVGS